MPSALPTHYTVTDTHYCKADYLRVPIGFIDQLRAMLDDRASDLRLPASCAAAAESLAALDTLWREDSTMPSKGLSQVKRLNPNGEESRRKFTLSHLFEAPFARVEARWAQREELAHRANLDEPGWNGIRAPKSCFPGWRSDDPNPNTALYNFEPFARAMWLPFPIEASLIAGCAPDRMKEPAHLVDAGRQTLKRLAASCGPACKWIAKALDLYVDHAFPLLEVWPQFRDHVEKLARRIPTAPHRHVSADEHARGWTQRTVAYAAYAEDRETGERGFVDTYGDLRPLDWAVLSPTPEAAFRKARDSHCAIVKVSIKVERVAQTHNGCDATPVLAACAEMEKRALLAAMAPGGPAGDKASTLGEGAILAPREKAPLSKRHAHRL